MRALAVVILVIGFILGGWATARADQDTPAERLGKVTADRLNLRASPTTTGDVVGSMQQSDEVTILEEQGEWYRLRLADGRTGWAARKYIEVVTAAPAGQATPAEPSPSEHRARETMTPRSQESEGGGGGGGGSVIGAVLKWGCLLGAGACGYVAYNEHTKGNDSYDSYKSDYNHRVQLGETPDQALKDAEPLRLDAEDHDKKAQNFGIAAGALGAAFLVQQLFLGHGHDQAAAEPMAPPDPPLLACGLTGGQLRASVTLARF